MLCVLKGYIQHEIINVYTIITTFYCKVLIQFLFVSQYFKLMNAVFHLFQLERLCFTKVYLFKTFRDFPRDAVVKTPCSPCRGHKLDPWLGNQKIKSKNPSTLSIGIIRFI